MLCLHSYFHNVLKPKLKLNLFWIPLPPKFFSAPTKHQKNKFKENILPHIINKKYKWLFYITNIQLSSSILKKKKKTQTLITIIVCISTHSSHWSQHSPVSIVMNHIQKPHFRSL